MKESWINKLIELLNEYRTEKGERNLNESEVSQTLDSLNYLRLFIKRLVDNDKIDQFYYENSVRVKRYIDEYEEYDYVFPIDYEQLIMLLSISDSPIADLISYLK